MDSFTQRMMNRATTRRAEFEQQMNDILAEDDDIDDPSLGVMLEARRREYREILRSGGVHRRTDNEGFDDKENASGKSASAISDVTKTRLNKLVPLYTGGDAEGAFPSPVGYGRRQAERELKECQVKAAASGKYCEQRSKRLAQLATAINNWEDESDKKLAVTSRSEQSTAKPVSKPVSSPALRKKMEHFDKTTDKKSTSTKKVVWDDKVIHTLEMQGFQRCDSDQHLVFDYKSPQKSPADCSRGAVPKVRPSPKRHPAPAPPSPAKHSYSEEPVTYRSESPVKYRSESPVKYRSESPVKYRSESPNKYLPESRVEHRSESPVRYRSESPVKYRSDSPVKYRPESPVKYRSESPVKYRSESPMKYQSESPERFHSGSPTKFRSESPVKFRGESPYKHHDESPVQYRAGSPVKFRAESPCKYQDESPIQSRAGSPVKFRSGSPTKSRPESPVKFRSDSPLKFRSDSPVKMYPDSPTKSVHSIAISLMHETLPVKKVEPSVNSKQKSVAPRPPSPKKMTSGSAVLEMAAKYETESSPSRKVKDPTELSIHDRMAIFERNTGGAILPKAPFGMPVPAKVLQGDGKTRPKSPERTPMAKKVEWRREEANVESQNTVSQSVLDRQKEIEMLRTRWERKREENVMQGGPKAELPPEYRRPPVVTATHKKGAAPPPPPLPQVATPNKIRMGTRSPVRSERSPDQSPNRSPTLSPTRDTPHGNTMRNHGRISPRKSSEMVDSLSQIKKIKVSPPKPGRIYPSISDIETESEALDTESEVHESDFDIPPHQARSGYCSDSEESAFSFGRAVVQRARMSQTNLKRGITTSSIRSSSSSSTISPDISAQESRILHEMDDFLDEALLGDVSPPKRSRESIVTPISNNDGKKTLQPSGSSGSCQSDSFEFRPKDEIKKTPLVHTVSTYRKLEAQRTPRKELYDMEMEVERALKDETPESSLVEERIFELEREMIKQTTIISQATQALNLCHARPEFAGSQEQVEAEKLLLIATSRRLASLHEVERLKVEKTLKPGGLSSNADKGSLTIEYISLPIKMCPTEPDKTDHFLCLVTSGVTVQATQVLALKKHNLTRGNRLAFTKPITLQSLYCDFTVTLEVYRLTCKNSGASVGGPSGADSKEEKKLAKLRLTPQLKKSTPKRNNRIPIESPGGPNSIRSPSFKMVGFVVFSLREVRRNKFTLNKVPYGVPLDGTIELSMSSALKSEVEYRGFLTQFEEVSGFGAWKRKWALLKGSTITFWLYPEHEEQNKIPIDTVDLSTVKNKEIGLVSREICARPHTILLETDCGERKLLSADTLDDRVAWTKAINKSLQLIRAWSGRSY